MRAWLTSFRLKLKALVLRNRFDAGLEDEFRFHLEMRERHYRERGLAAEAARNAARRRTGNVTFFQETTREMRTFMCLEALWRDVVLTVRMFLRDPGFSFLAVLILALGIGVNLAAFSVMDALLMRVLPVEDPGSLFRTTGAKTSADDASGGACSLALFQQMQARTRGLAELTAYNLAQQQTLTWNGGRELRVYHQIVSGNYFQVLGLRAAIGRFIAPNDDTVPGHGAIAVISNRLWKQGFGASTAAVGSRLEVDRQSFEIVGVAPSGFFGVEMGKVVDVWTPIAAAPMENLQNDHLFWLHPVGRLAPGVTVARAAARMASTLNQFMLEDARAHAPAGTPQAVINRFLDDMKIRGVPAGGGVASLRKEYRPALQAVMALAVIVLLICCTNVANLLLAKGAGRRQEIALRLSLGASRLRILQQLITGNILLAIAAATLGAIFSQWTTPFFVRMLRPSSDAVELPIQLDFRLLGFAAFLAFLTVMISGLLPAFQLLRPDLATSLRSRTGLMNEKTGRQQKFLVVTQVALAFVLAVGALLFSRTLTNLLSTPVGFVSDDVLIARLSIPRIGSAASSFAAAWTQLLERLRSAPDIKAAALSSTTLFDGEPPYIGLRGDAKQAMPVPPTAAIVFVSADYFHTLGIPLAKGRVFDEHDSQPNRSPAVVVNEAFVAKFYGSEDPLSHKLTKIADSPNWSEIIGVVKNVRVCNLRGPAPPILYVPYTAVTAWRAEAHPGFEMTLQVQRRQSAAPFLPELQRLAGSQFKISTVSEQRQLIDDTLVRERLLSRIAELFGILCVLLAAVGVYAVMNYSVLQRRRDIGIRLALGASPTRILTPLIADAGRAILIGIVAGAVIATFASRAARGLLFGLTPGDPVTYAGAALLLLVTMYAAALIPAWRGSLSDPVIALRSE